MFLRPNGVAAVALSFAMAFPAAAQDQNVTRDTVVATVNGQDITVGHMLVLRARLPQQYQQLPNEMLFTVILDQLVQQAALGTTTDGLSDVARIMLENEERALLATEAVEAITAEKVTEEAVAAAYEEQYLNAPEETEYNASHILVETEEEAQALVESLRGGADFAETARETSTGPSGPNGGNLGWFGLGMMVPPFEEAVVALEVGAISDPVETQFGWHVITLNETRVKTAPPLEEVAEELRSGLQTAAVGEALEALMGEIEITRAEPGEIDPAVIGNPDLLRD